jgi:aryl-alcohol dehydrogenase-like predicted oxidoreductase
VNATRPLGRSDLQVPRLGLGAMTWGQPAGWARWTPAQLAYGPSHGAEAEAEALAVSLAAGVSLVDTAAMYSNGAAERRVGALTGGRPVVVATKFPPAPFDGVAAFPRALAGSRARLGRDTIDLYQHHFPSRRVPIAELMARLADAVAAGQVKAVGVSNYSAAEMRLAHAELAKRGVPLASNQVQYSLLYRRPEVDGVLEACRELGVTLIAYSPLAMGALTGKYTAGQRAGGLRRVMPSFGRRALEAAQPVVDLLRRIGERYGKTPSQVALRWLMEDEMVLPIPGAKSGRQAAENAGALTFSLTAAEVEELGRATARWRR